MAKVASKKKLQFWGTGRRKKAIARVRLIPGGAGNIVINKRSIDDYCDTETVKLIIKQPLVLTDTLTKYDVFVNVVGGGYTGQAGAIRHGIARALILAEPELREALKKAIKDNEAILLDIVIDSEEALPMLPPGAGINEMIGEYKLEKDVI